MKLRVAFAVCLIVAPAAADPVTAILDEMRAVCAQGGMELVGPESVWAPLDLGADAPDAQIFVSTDWGCPQPPAPFRHTGGGEVVLRAEGQHFQATARGWMVTELWDVPTVILSRHGTFCDGSGYQPCFEAVTWSDGRWLSVSLHQP